jgi:hypothetical protein
MQYQILNQILRIKELNLGLNADGQIRAHAAPLRLREAKSRPNSRRMINGMGFRDAIGNGSAQHRHRVPKHQSKPCPVMAGLYDIHAGRN